MNRSESIVNLSKALLKAQQQMESAKKDSANPFFKSKYADYNAVLEACKGPLNDNGIVILQPTNMRSNPDGTTQLVIETTLIHAESGEFISSMSPVVVAKQNDPQALGSGISYQKRYSLQSLISLPSDDDDGEGAMDRNQKPQGRAPVAPVKPVAPAPKVETKVETKPEAPEAPARRRVAVPAEEVKPAPKVETKPVETKVETKPVKPSEDQW